MARVVNYPLLLTRWHDVAEFRFLTPPADHPLTTTVVAKKKEGVGGWVRVVCEPHVDTYGKSMKQFSVQRREGSLDYFVIANEFS